MGSFLMMSVSESLNGVTRLAVDTSRIIYFLEEHEKYDRVVAPVFQKIAEGSVLGFSSVISLCEVLVQPMKKGDSKLQDSYRD